jgi:Na+/melibiose symporter-like transporter
MGVKWREPAGRAGKGGAGPGSLWRNGDFMKLWGGETFSQLGSQITQIALPLTAIIVLHAGAVAVGLLASAQYAPILVSMFAGPWVDRHRTRRVMMLIHLGRAGLVSTVPLLYAFHALSMAPLFATAFAAGCLTALFNIIYISYMPSIVAGSVIIDANAKLEATYTLAGIGGPGIGGVLVQALTAPFAILADAATYIVAAAVTSRIRHVDVPAIPDPDAPSTLAQARQGITSILRHPVLRPIALSAGCFNLFGSGVFVLYLLYGTRSLHLSPGALGAMLAISGTAGIAGTLVVQRISRKLGTGRTLVWSMALGSVPLGLIPAAAGARPVVIAMLVTGLIFNGFGLTVCNVLSLSLRAAVVAPEQLGSLTASFRALSNGTLPLGGLLAALLGGEFGTRAALAILVTALTVNSICFVLSRARRFDLQGGVSLPALGGGAGEGEEKKLATSITGAEPFPVGT